MDDPCGIPKALVLHAKLFVKYKNNVCNVTYYILKITLFANDKRLFLLSIVRGNSIDWLGTTLEMHNNLNLIWKKWPILDFKSNWNYVVQAK